MGKNVSGVRNLKLRLISAGVFGIFALTCGGVWLFSEISARTRPMYPHWNCLQLSSAEVVGRWRASDVTRNETLIIRGDGTYRQTIHIQHIGTPNKDYEGDWHVWALEQSAHGSYLHLQQMNLCAAFQGLNDCEDAAGVDARWGDYCRGDFSGVPRPANIGEGILVALKAPGFPQLPRGLELVLLYEQESPWVYERQQP